MKEIFEQIEEFCQTPHGSSNYGEDNIYVKGEEGRYAPFSFLQKKMPSLTNSHELLKAGFIFSSYDVIEDSHFSDWYKAQFAKKLPVSLRKKIFLLSVPDDQTIFKTIGVVCRCYQTLREHQIIINNKNLPIQIGEWYAKSILGLKQVRSSSQRGFDFFINDKHVEVKVHWNDRSSPKGVKIRKSLVKLSDFVVIIYVAKDFTLRDICFLDSAFVERKFDSKGHTIFLKDQDVFQYFFSNSSKHFDKVANKTSLMKFATPIFAMKLDERI